MRVSALAGALLVSALVPAGVTAQACLGLPSADGQIAVGATGEFSAGDFDLGGEFHVDVTGPASFRLGYTNGHSETVGSTDVRVGRGYSALGAYELYLLDPSICALASGIYYTDAGPDVEDRFGVSLGFGIGKTLEAEAFSATIFAMPQYVRFWETTALDETIEANEFMAEAGLTFGFPPFFVGGAVTLTSVEGVDPGLKIRAGVLF